MDLSPERIKAARIAAGLSLRGAARLVQASKATLINTERGDSAPRSDLLGRMARVYGVGVERFFVEPLPQPIGCGATNDEED